MTETQLTNHFSARVRRVIAPALSLVLATGLTAQQPSRLPAVPAVNGPLALRIAWPAPGSALTMGDSTFAFGTLGNGRATLTVGGRPVAVAPNGAWIAWVPVARDSVVTLGFEATLDGERATATLPLVRADWVREQGAWVDRNSIAPVGEFWFPEAEPLVLTVRAAPGALVRLRMADGSVVRFAAEKTLPQVPPGIREFDRDERNLLRSAKGDRYVGVYAFPARKSAALAWSVDWLTPAPRATGAPSAASGKATLEVILRGDTTRVPWQLSLNRAGHALPVVLDDGTDGGPWRPVSGRPLPGRGTYTWFFPQGTWTRADARWNGEVRLRLSSGALAWVPVAAVHVQGSGDPRPALLSSLTLSPRPDRTTLRIPLTRPVPVDIDEDEQRLTITLFDAVAIADWTRYGANDSFVRSVTWRQVTADQVALTINFNRPLWGWRNHVDGSDLVFEFRQPPVIDSLRPLAGRHVVVDAGHPPGGACGPVGLCEPEVNLAIAGLVRDGLRRAGARVTMTRSTMESVALRARSALADSLDADLFVSIHNNAFPDGVNPFTNSGTSTFYNHVPSLPLARLVQRRLVESFGLRDLGVARGDLSVVRPTWYPAILTEGMFLMVPAQEAALRTTDIQQRYADAVVAGIREFLQDAARPSSR